MFDSVWYSREQLSGVQITALVVQISSWWSDQYRFVKANLCVWHLESVAEHKSFHELFSRSGIVQPIVIITSPIVRVLATNIGRNESPCDKIVGAK